MDRETKLSELVTIVSRDVTAFCAEKGCVRGCLKTIAMVSSRDKIEAVCLHETGHFVESMRLGIMVGFTEKEIGFHKPRVIHKIDMFGKDRFEPNPGSIFTPFDALKISWTLPILQQAARVAVAGGVYAHQLANVPFNKGTGGDRDLYETYYRLALPTLHAHPGLLVASKLWDCAKDEVAGDLKASPELEQLARWKAQYFKTMYYDPFLEFCDLAR
jgi:hypothetical protein